MFCLVIFTFEVLAFYVSVKNKNKSGLVCYMPLLFYLMLCFATFVMPQCYWGIDSSAMSNGPFYSCFE